MHLVSITALVIVMLVMLTVFYFIVYRQQATIERLTDRLMSKDYREYVSVNQLTQPPEPTEEERRRKPMSFFDDPNIPIDDD